MGRENISSLNAGDGRTPCVVSEEMVKDIVIGIAIEPKTQKDMDKLGVALAKLAGTLP